MQYLFFCCKKMKPNSSQWRIDRKFEQMGFGRMDEKRLLKKLRNGDEKALAKIIDIYSAYISKIVGMIIFTQSNDDGWNVEEGTVLRFGFIQGQSDGTELTQAGILEVGYILNLSLIHI